MSKSKELPISCICCVYKYTILDELILAIDSLLIQKYIPSEIVIIVDGIINKDIVLFLKDTLNKKSIFKVFFIKENVGLGLALKYGIPKCKNNLVARFDSDDINLKDRLKIQFDFMERHKEISIIGSDVFEFNTINNDLIIKKMKNNFQNKNLLIRNPLNHPTIVFRKEDIIRVGSYKNMKLFEDYELWLRCLKNGLRIHNIEQTLVAMKRINYFSKREGFQYALYEINFLREAIKEKTINITLIPIYLIRIFIRILPVKISLLALLIDSSRKKYNKFNLDKYIKTIQENNLSLFQELN